MSVQAFRLHQVVKFLITKKVVCLHRAASQHKISTIMTLYMCIHVPVGYVDIASIEEFSSGNNSAIFQRASALASTYFLTQGDSSSSSVLSTGAIVGIVISVIVVVLLLLVAILVVVGFAVRSRKSKE